MTGSGTSAEQVLDRAETEAVRSGLPAFGIEPSSIRLLSRSENVVFAVETSDGRQVVARLHRPGYNSVAELDSEVAWVTALADDGVPVPRAIPLARTGGSIGTGSGHYTEVTVDLGDTAAEDHRWMGLIDWVDGLPLGSPVGGELEDVPRLYRNIGALAAKVRAQASGWTPPDGFIRRRWDRDAFVGPEPLWGRFWEVDGLTPAQRSLFTRARDEVAERLGDLATGPDRFGLIHADLHLGNVMTDDEAFTIIDFDDSGFGWYPFELAVALHPILDHPELVAAHAAIVDGYRSVHPISDEEVGLVDLFITVRCLMLIGWLDARRNLPVYEYASELTAETEDVVTRFLETGRAFTR